MNAFKRVLAIVLSILMLTLMCACNKNGKDDNGNTKTSEESLEGETSIVRLPYSREDGVNPFAAKSLMNEGVMSLIYSGLYTLDNTYQPKPDLASDYTTDADAVTVTLASKRFSDGTPVTADDVVYSFNCALTSAYYASSLLSITSASAANSNTVIFKTAFPDVFATSCLTFPIVKSNTADGGTTAVPVGAGKYVYKDTVEGGELHRNGKYADKTYKMEKVTLVNMTGSESLMYGLVIGNFDATFDDLSRGQSQRINASVAQVQMNNLIYLGLSQGGVFADPVLRQQLSAMIDRDALISSGLEGYGTATVSPFYPKWYAAKGATLPKTSANEAEDYLAESIKGTINILVNSDNNFKVKLAETLASDLTKAGVKTKLTSVPFAAYSASVASGAYDIYIGEYKLTNDMNISSLITDEELKLQYSEMLAGNVKCADFMTAFFQKQPFVPVCYRNGVLAYSRSVKATVTPTPNNAYANLNEWFI